MFQLDLNRIRLIPLSLEQLYVMSAGRNELDKVMGLALSDFELNSEVDLMDELTEAVDSFIIPRVQDNLENYRWFTHWIVVDKASSLNVGGFGVAGLPDEHGETLLGYYIDRKFEGQGYATEALAGLLEWMFENPDLKTVVADTYVDGYASQRVLQKNGFRLRGPSEEGLRWYRTR